MNGGIGEAHRRRLRAVRDFAGRFLWQLLARLGEQAVAGAARRHPAAPDERSEEFPAGSRFVRFGLVIPHGLLAPLLVAWWILSGRGPGARLLVFKTGSAPQLPSGLEARARNRSETPS